MGSTGVHVWSNAFFIFTHTLVHKFTFTYGVTQMLVQMFIKCCCWKYEVRKKTNIPYRSGFGKYLVGVC